MTQESFIKKITELYFEAREAKSSSANIKIERVTSHTISSFSEDLFAKYCADLLPKDKNTIILIDPQITFDDKTLKNKTGNRPLLFRPDICIVKNDVIEKVIDLKTDTGYKRELIVKKANEWSETCEKIKGLRAIIKNGNTKKEKNYTISKRLKSCIISLTTSNTTPKAFELSKKAIKENTGIILYALSNDKLNDYSSGKRIAKPNKIDFDKVDKFILS